MGGGRGRKRKLRQLQDPIDQGSRSSIHTDANLISDGAASTLAYLREQDQKQDVSSEQPLQSQLQSQSQSTAQPDQEDGEEWQTVPARGNNKKTNYPLLTYSTLHRLQSSVKLGDLQALVLYCLADGVPPQWISVKHHDMVRRAVVLFVPGLERSMFDGDILSRSESHGADPVKDDVKKDQADKSEPEEQELGPNQFNKLHVASSGEFLPISLNANALPPPLQPLADIFSHVWPIKAPGDDRMNKVHSPLQAMLQSPLTKSQEEKKADKSNPGPRPAREGVGWEDKRTVISEYILSPSDLLENEYVLHPALWPGAGLDTEEQVQNRLKKHQSADDGWVDSRINKLSDTEPPTDKIESGSITAGRQILAVDCEMCTVQGGESALTRISLVNWDRGVVMDELVKPDLPIIDYLTPYSGITAAKLDDVTTSLQDIQHRMLDLLTPTTILIGHSLDSDLAALKMSHPCIVDTSVLYPHPRGPPMKSSLKWLAQRFLSREIQKGHGATGHDSIEDACACLDLVKVKCEKGPRWGTQEATVESIFKRLRRTPRPGHSRGSSVPNQVKTSNGDGAASASLGKTGAIVDHGKTEKNFGQMAEYCITCASDKEIVAATLRCASGDPDGLTIPGGGVDFTWARLRELDIARGWRGDNRNEQSVNADGTPKSELDKETLIQRVGQTVSHLRDIYSQLPPCTLFVVYSGTGDPRRMARLQERQRTFKKEFKTKKWEEIQDKWTDVEEQALRKACRKARKGIGLVAISQPKQSTSSS